MEDRSLGPCGLVGCGVIRGEKRGRRAHARSTPKFAYSGLEVLHALST